jgi:hypothetical protein
MKIIATNDVSLHHIILRMPVYPRKVMIHISTT